MILNFYLCVWIKLICTLITTICYLLFIGSIHFMIFNKAIFNFNISILDCSHDFIFLTGYKLGFNYLKAKRFVDAIDVCHKVCSFFLNYCIIFEICSVSYFSVDVFDVRSNYGHPSTPMSHLLPFQHHISIIFLASNNLFPFLGPLNVSFDHLPFLTLSESISLHQFYCLRLYA